MIHLAEPIGIKADPAALLNESVSGLPNGLVRVYGQSSTPRAQVLG